MTINHKPEGPTTMNLCPSCQYHWRNGLVPPHPGGLWCYSSNLKRGDVVDTPHGRGTVVGFDRQIRRAFVQVPGVAGAHAVKYAECREVDR